MKNAIILHGKPDKEEYYSDAYPSCSNSHWLPWLQKQLLIQDIYAVTPELPQAYKPVYEKWQKEFEKHPVTKDTLLVGHSCGAGFLLRWLSDSKKSGDKLVLVAPWIDPEKKKVPEFFDFVIDSEIQNRFNYISIFISHDDSKEVLDSFEIIKKALPKSVVHEFDDKGHFCYEDLHTEQFPELLDVLLLD